MKGEGDFHGLTVVMFSLYKPMNNISSIERSQQLHPSPTSLLKDLDGVSSVAS